MIYVAESAGKGRGVFAKEQIRAGTTFERAPVIVLPPDEWVYAERTVLFDYCYDWQGGAALALGAGSLFNHSYTPNAIYIKNYNQFVIEYRALRDIAPGEEILINYNGQPDDMDPLWFAVTTEASTPHAMPV
ncbi:MAG TPA: SET domain-containing protein [Caldilineaceae bacterium]|nr:SET domain-containing protein [Caldilineaceae bacterium]